MKNWSYENAGVSIDKGNQWIDIIKDVMRDRPHDDNLIGGIGGFNGLYRLNDTTLIAGCCDGVGTKLEIARAASSFDGLGQDLVAMSVNDLVTCGARPLFFLDYIACGKLNTAVMKPIIQGIADACYASGCALLGGETAEMPGVYPEEGFDLAGFAIGIVEEKDLIDGKSITKGDIILGLPSSGVHSNGYSLVRKVLLDGREDSLFEMLPHLGETLSASLLRPTRLYVKQALRACSTGKVKGMAHITGGGLEENISRVLSSDLKLNLNYASWTRPSIFDHISQAGVEEEEMRRVFNLGIGFVFIASPQDVETVTEELEALGEKPVVIGSVE